MPPRDLRAYLFDIAEACRLIEDFTRGASFADYERTVFLQERVSALLLELDDRRQ